MIMLRKKIHLKKHKKFQKKHIILITMFFCLISVIITINIINKKFVPILLEISEIEIGKFSTIIVNKAIAQVLDDKIDTNKLFDTVINDSGEIQTVDFNPIVVNHILNIATSVVQNNLALLEEGKLDEIGVYDMKLPEERVDKLKKGIISEIPIGAVTGNAILSNLGPAIPIRLHYVGDVTSNITTKLTQYGINNALIEIGVHLTMNAKIILPFIVTETPLEFDIPLAIKMIQGKIPTYYGNGLSKESSLYSIPLGN